MKIRWQLVLATVLALVLLLSVPMVTLAQSEKGDTESSKLALKGALAIVAPWVGFAGKQVSMTVFLRENQEPFAGAGVWALTREEAESVKKDVAELKKDDSQPAAEKDYEKVLANRGIFLGRTGGDGSIKYTFEQAGNYLLVAAKKGYVPGFTGIHIREGIDALGIEAPKRAPVGEKVTITVFERITHDPVEGAGVWAVTRDKLEALKEAVAALKEDKAVSATEKDYEAVVKLHGFFLGRTDKHGKLEHTFNEAGGYLLITVKRGYIPGWTAIGIVDTLKALGIKAPLRTRVGKEVDMTVFERESSDPVAGAGVWAISKEKVEALKKDAAALREDKNIAAAEKDYESVVKVHGTLLGRTDEKGRLSHTFNQAGGYLLVAVKKGYIPGFSPLSVIEPPQPKTEKGKAA